MKKLVIICQTAFLLFTIHVMAWGTENIPAHKPVFFFSNTTDYFRTIASGDWAITTTWESSPDNGVTPWAAATLTPTSAANTITIRNTYSVNVSSNLDVDQVVIESGSILSHIGGAFTIMDGASGDDIIVQGGGTFTLASASNPPIFSVSTATANINTGGILRVSTSGLTAAGVGVNASNYIYQNASVLEYNYALAFSTAGVTYFPNVNAATIPIFRTTNNMGIVGANTNTIFNGSFEANGNITFANSGTKTFRNGIIGTGNIDGSGSGKFIINGTTASLGGTGLLTLPTVNGMDIGSSSTVTMVSDKSVTGNIALLTNALVMLGSNNLTMTGDITGGSTTSHIVTNGSGKLVINNISGATPRIFPIGANTTTINPMAIFNGGGLNYGARVEIGINPSIRFPVAAINRTWVVRPSGTPSATVNVNLFYATGEGNALFSYAPATVELGFYTSVWNVINTGLTQNGGPTNFQVTGTVNTFGTNIDAPLVIANIGAILEINNSIQLTAQKQNDKILLNWTVDHFADILQFIPERSADGRTYSALATLLPADLSFTDVQPLPGLNYYRIKMKDKNGKLTVSNTAVILNAQKGFELISISPNPVVNANVKLNVSAAEKTSVEFIITDIHGRMMQKQSADLIAGYNAVTINVAKLSWGTYQVYGITANGRSGILRFVIQ